MPLRTQPASVDLPRRAAGMRSSTARRVVRFLAVPGCLRHTRSLQEFTILPSCKHSRRAQSLRSHCKGATCAAASVRDVGSDRGMDLLVVGPGVLGGLVGKLWKDEHPAAQVVGQTNTDTNHDRLRHLGLTPRLKQGCPADKFPSIVFSAPPSGSTDYVDEVQRALKLWDGTGTFVFTSSTGVCNPAPGDVITEDSPLHHEGSSERIDRLLKCEQAVLAAGGCVVRLVGLYHAQRGAHTFFLRQGEVQRWGGHLVNLIHYEDAAGLCLRVLQGGADGPYKGRLFFGTDGHGISFQEMMDAALASGAFQGSVQFTGAAEEYPGPTSSNARTRQELTWQPKFESFKAFMANGATDFYSSA